MQQNTSLIVNTLLLFIPQTWIGPFLRIAEILRGNSLNCCEIVPTSSKDVSSTTGRRRKVDCLWEIRGDEPAVDLLFFENSVSKQNRSQHTGEDNAKLVCGCGCARAYVCRSVCEAVCVCVCLCMCGCSGVSVSG